MDATIFTFKPSSIYVYRSHRSFEPTPPQVFFSRTPSRPKHSD